MQKRKVGLYAIQSSIIYLGLPHDPFPKTFPSIAFFVTENDYNKSKLLTDYSMTKSNKSLKTLD